MRPSPRPPSLRILAALGAFAALGCTGNIDDPNARGGGGGDKPRPGDGKTPPPDDKPLPPAPAGTTASAAPLRRLNAEQYRNTIKDLFGLKDAVPAASLPA